MEALRRENIASVEIIEARLSEDELAAYEGALSYALEVLDAEELEKRLGASRDEVEGILDDLREALRTQAGKEPLVKAS